MKQYIVLLSFAILFGCELVVDVEVPFEESNLTLNTYFNPDSLWSAYVSANRHVLDNGPFEMVKDARIIIYEDGVPVDTLVSKPDGLYQSDSGMPTAGKRYSVTVDATGFRPISAESSLPSPVQIVSARFSKVESEIEHELRTTLKIKDPLEKNFYQVLLQREQEYYDFRTETITTVREIMHLKSDDPILQNESEAFSESMIFNDVFFNGKEIEFTFGASLYAGAGFASTTLILRTLSEEYYKYILTTTLQENTSGDPFAQPVNVYNNIRNGFGIFGGYSSATYIESMPRPVITAINPPVARPGDHVIITGDNFLTNPDNQITVYFKGDPYVEYATVVESSNTRLDVIVPMNAVTGKIAIESGRVVISDSDFQITR